MNTDSRGGASDCQPTVRQSNAGHTIKDPFLGFAADSRPSFGFHRASAFRSRRRRADPVIQTGESHLLSIGMTGSGKTNLAIANLLLYEGSAIVLDVRGDVARTTERYRREMLGQATFVLDPFGITGLPQARLDPFDVIRLPRTAADIEAQSIAATLAAGHRCDREPFWHGQASNIMGGLTAHLLSQPDLNKRSLNRMVQVFFNEDAVYQLAVLMDSEVAKHSFAYEGIGAFLQLPDGQGNTRGCVLATVHSMIHALRCEAIRASMGSSTVDLLGLLAGRPMTLYLVMPVERMESHGVALRLWLDLLLQVLIRRMQRPTVPTLVVVDEAAQIGPCPAIKTIATYLRASGVRLWTFWQDLSQLKNLYPDWQTLVNNTSAITFMPGTALAGRELAAMLDVPVGMVEKLASSEQLVCEPGQAPRLVQMARYWKDALFKGRFDPIPRYAPPAR